METEQWKTVAGDHSVTQIICEYDCSWSKSGDRLPPKRRPQSKAVEDRGCPSDHHNWQSPTSSSHKEVAVLLLQ